MFGNDVYKQLVCVGFSVRFYVHYFLMFHWRFRFLFAVCSIQEDATEYENSPNPLMREEGVAEHDDGPENCEELPGGGDDGAGQGTKLTHAHEDEELK